jgi:hypothetical protein
MNPQSSKPISRTRRPFYKLSDKVHLLGNLHEISYTPGACPEFLMARKHDLFAICNPMASSLSILIFIRICHILKLKQTSKIKQQMHKNIQ